MLDIDAAKNDGNNVINGRTRSGLSAVQENKIVDPVAVNVAHSTRRCSEDA